MSYEPGIFITAWLIAGQAIYSLRRLSFHMLWKKLSNTDPIGGQTMQSDATEDPMARHFAPSETKSGGQINVHRYPGALNTDINLGYWILILVTWPVWASFGFSSTFLGLSWLWQEGAPDIPTSPEGFWKWVRNYIWYWQLPKAEREKERDTRRRARERKLLLASRHRQLEYLTRETAYEFALPTVDQQILRQELLPHADLDDSDTLPFEAGRPAGEADRAS